MDVYDEMTQRWLGYKTFFNQIIKIMKENGYAVLDSTSNSLSMNYFDNNIMRTIDINIEQGHALVHITLLVSFTSEVSVEIFKKSIQYPSTAWQEVEDVDVYTSFQLEEELSSELSTFKIERILRIVDYKILNISE